VDAKLVDAVVLPISQRRDLDCLIQMPVAENKETLNLKKFQKKSTAKGVFYCLPPFSPQHTNQDIHY